ncbi:unnamed protein product [Linum tenue]|uniref:Uncharacterized protein n=1 Tax=Linum tenue TaxID=586396 RepID=A0AAV0JFL6_9ROSI|nr:unnamed protein product [Linum tenue]
MAAIFLARRSAAAAVCVDSSASRLCGLATLPAAEGRRQEGRGIREHDHNYSGEEGAAAFVADTLKEGVKKATEVADAVGEGVKRTVDGAWRAGSNANQEVKETVAGDAGGGDTGVKVEDEETVVDQVVEEMKKVDGPVDMAEYRAMEQNMEDSKQ